MKKIEIKKLRLENFMSFVGEHIIDFGHITNVFGWQENNRYYFTRFRWK